MEKLFVFDLDGTLNRTDLFSVDAHQKVLAEFGWPVQTPEEITSHFGEVGHEFMLHILPGADENTVLRYRNRISEVEHEYIERAAAYDGCPQLLDILHERGYRTAICSNSSYRYISMVLSAIDLMDRIDFIQPLEAGMHTKSESLGCLLKKICPETAVMVGDTLLDYQAAVDNSIPFIGCEYGFRPAEMRPLDYSVKYPLEILTLVDRVLS